jgi:hypothetical protein
VTTLSDTIDGAGRKNTDEAFKANRLTDRFSALKWPRQSVLITKQQNLWKNTLEAAYMSLGQILKQCLGKWTGIPSQTWYNFYDPQSSRLFTSSNSAGNWLTHCFIEHAVTTTT